MRRVIVNSTPLIVLCNVGRLEILRTLYTEMREKGCGIEMLAAIFDSDCSTVKRTLKKAEVKTDDGI